MTKTAYEKFTCTWSRNAAHRSSQHPARRLHLHGFCRETLAVFPGRKRTEFDMNIYVLCFFSGDGRGESKFIWWRQTSKRDQLGKELWKWSPGSLWSHRELTPNKAHIALGYGNDVSHSVPSQQALYNWYNHCVLMSSCQHLYFFLWHGMTDFSTHDGTIPSHVSRQRPST